VSVAGFDVAGFDRVAAFFDCLFVDLMKRRINTIRAAGSCTGFARDAGS
jgi:hypothetical protein